MKKWILSLIAVAAVAIPAVMGCWIEWDVVLPLYTIFFQGTCMEEAYAGLIIGADGDGFYDTGVHQGGTLYVSQLVVVGGTSYTPDYGRYPDYDFEHAEPPANNWKQSRAWPTNSAKIYVYSVTSVNGDSVTVNSQVTTSEIKDLKNSVSEDKLAESQTALAQLLQNASSNKQLLFSLKKINGGNQTINLKEQPPEAMPGDRAVQYMLIEKLEDASQVSVRKVDFSKCTISKLNETASLPFTPYATLGKVTVTTETHNTTAGRYHVKSALQDFTLVVLPEDGALTDSAAATTTKEYEVTAATCTVTDSLGDSTTVRAPFVDGSSEYELPIWGRYAVSTDGTVDSEQVKCHFTLTAAGVSSDGGDKVLTIVTPPNNADQTITVKGSGRPLR